jgi:tRNA pseudouridine38-40 synthase
VLNKKLITRNLLLKLRFDGTNYHGWQIQKNALSVQEVFQNCLEKILYKNIDIKACSRTDTGVHANMFYVSMKIKHHILCKNFTMALNKFLPKDICVYDCCEVPLNFHARYSCKSKEYVYKILNSKIRNPFLNGYVLHHWRPINIKKLKEAASFFVGTHDFTSFCTLDSRKKGDFIRTVKNLNIKKTDNSMIEVIIEADGFLYNMVRIIVGTLLKVNQGLIKPCEIENILNLKNRSAAGPTSSGCGLYLNKIFYK